MRCEMRSVVIKTDKTLPFLPVQMAEVQAEEASAAEKCCLRVDTLEETVVSLKLHHVFYSPAPRV